MSTIPYAHFAANLMWTRAGTVSATFGLAPMARARTEAEASVIAMAHASLFRALAGKDVLLRGLLTWTDPGSVIARMAHGVDLVRNPGWAAECDATIDLIGDRWYGQRRWYLSVPVAAGRQWALASAARSALNRMAEAAGLSVEPPTGAEVAAYQAAAERLLSSLPSTFRPEPVPTAELVWTLRHAQSRSPFGDYDPRDAPDLAADLLDVAGRAAIGEPWLDAMALTDADLGPAGKARAPFERRCLKVVCDTGEINYQCGLVLADTPGRGMMWPMTEFLGRVDDAATALDVACWLRIRPRAVAMAKNKRSMSHLNDQLGQVGEEDPNQANHLLRLHDAAQILADYNTALVRDDHEVEVETVIMLSAAADTRTSAESAVGSFLSNNPWPDLTFARPIGAEEKIFWAMQPGGRIDGQLADYRHIATALDFATTAPVVSTELGADTGFLLGENKESGLRSPVLLDLFGDARSGSSPAILVAGELGAGKSKAQKKIAGHVVDRGGRVIAVDNSTTREWFTWARSLPNPDGGWVSVATCDVVDPATSVDPLRILPARLAGPVMHTFLIVLLNIAAQSPQGRTLAKVLKPAYLHHHDIRSSGALRNHLAQGCDLPYATEIADRIDVFSDPDAAGSTAAAIFDPALEPMDMTARVIVIGTSSVRIPSNEELEHEHLFANLSIAKIFGRALWALMAELGHQVCFADDSDPALFALGELHHVGSSREAIEVIADFIRYGRKTKSGLLAESHNPAADIRDRTLIGLIKTRLMMRNTDDEIAKSCAALIYDPSSYPAEHATLVEEIKGFSPRGDRGEILPDRVGEGKFMDARGRIGTIQVLHEAQPHRHEASNTTPPDQDQDVKM